VTLKIFKVGGNKNQTAETLKKTRIKPYNTLALPAMLYSSEDWTVTATDASRIRAVEMKYMRRTAGNTPADHKTNTEIVIELNITPIVDRIYDPKKKWIQYINRMPRSQLSRPLKNYTPTPPKGTQEYR
jgi:hypothetical protein